MASMSDRAYARDIRAALANRTSEADLQATLVEALELLGWRVHHETDSRRTSPGWPDLFAAHRGSGWWLALELKASTGQVTSDQIAWLHSLTGLELDSRPLTRGWLQVDLERRRLVGLVYPADLDAVLEQIAQASSP